MFRRRAPCATGTVSLFGHSGTACGPLCTASRTGFFDGLNDMMKKSMPSAAAGGGNTNGGGDSSKNANAGLPPGLDMQKLRTMQEMFNSQPPERQEQLMKQALEMQKMMSKMPGFKKMSQMNTQVLEELMKQKQQQSTSDGGGGGASHPFAGTQTPRASSGGGHGTTVPTLDDLKKINLGPEIEALFAELKSMRKKKNEYRDLYVAEKAKLEANEKARLALETSEKSLRGKLKKTEQEVMLLTSENMEVRDGAKNVKQLTAENAKLKSEVKALRHQLQSGTAAGSPQYHDLQMALQSKDDALRSLGRKVERMRRRDPLLHFSLCCNDLTRLCDLRPTGGDAAAGGSLADLSPPLKDILHHMANSHQHLSDEAAKEMAEERFAELQAAYVAVQQDAWLLAATGASGTTATSLSAADDAKPHAAARTYAAYLHRLYLSKLPYSNYDALVTVKAASNDGIAALRELLSSSFGYSLEKVKEGNAEDRYVIAAPASLTTRDVLITPGPFACAFALRAVAEKLSKPIFNSTREVLAAGNKPLAEALSSFSVMHAQPFVSETLIRNVRRVAITYEAARASGPGGQAVNVAETQVKAKLFIDQHPNPSTSGGTVTVDGVTLRVVSSGVDSGESTSGGATAAAANNNNNSSNSNNNNSGGAAAFAYFAESQDSRSALQNKTNATEKLLTVERRKYNDGVLRSPFGRCEDVEEVFRRVYLAEAGDVKLEPDVVRWFVEATSNNHNSSAIPPMDAVLVLAFRFVVEEARS